MNRTIFVSSFVLLLSVAFAAHAQNAGKVEFSGEVVNGSCEVERYEPNANNAGIRQVVVSDELRISVSIKNNVCSGTEVPFTTELVTPSTGNAIGKINNYRGMVTIRYL